MTIDLKTVAQMANNPGRVVPYILNETEQAISGGRLQFRSMTHPFPVAIDTITAMTYGLINRLSDAESRLFPKHARKPEDIYIHMADNEMWGLLGSPAKATMRFAIPVEEIKRTAVEYEEPDGSIVNRYRKLVIPRDTVIDVYGIGFTVANAIEIRLMQAGHIQIIYDTRDPNPFIPVTSNILERQFGSIGNKQFLFIDVPVFQATPTVKRNIGITSAAGLKAKYNFDDHLYGVRAWLQRPNERERTEISVSYDPRVFNQNEVTLVVSINQDEGYFTYEMPDIFINNEQGIGSLTLYIYTTKGAIEQDLSDIRARKHTVTYNDFNFDRNQLSRYSAPIRMINNSAWEISSSVTGGTNPRTFQELKEGYIFNSRRNSFPVSDNQLTYNFKEYGYDIVETLNYGTGRLFQLTRELPKLQNGKFSGSIDCFNGSVLYSLNELKATGSVYNNGRRVTIPSNSLFTITGSGNFLMNKTEVERLKQLTNDGIIDYTNRNRTVYNPYHYVVDSTNNTVDVRPYLLDQPNFQYQNFLYEKEKLGMELGVSSIAVEHREDGYLVRLVTRSDRNYRELSDDKVGVQLYITPKDAAGVASLKGRLVGKTAEKERVWEFLLGSTYDVNSADQLILNNFQMFGRPQTSTLVDLTHPVNILFLMEGSDDGKESSADRKIDTTLFPNPMLVIVEVGYQLTFGKSLDKLFSRVRPIKGMARYKTYPNDIPEYHLENTYKRKPNGDYVIENNAFVIDQPAGTPKTNPDGSPIYLHHRGDLVYDENGKLIELEPSEMKMHFDFLGFDGNYYFSNDDYDKEFALSMKSYISNVVMQDMEHFASVALDFTRVAFIPKMRLGSIPVVLNSQTETNVNADLTFQVTFYLTKSGHQNETLKEVLRERTAEVIRMSIEGQTMSKRVINKNIETICTDDVTDYKVVVLSNNQELDVATNLDGTTGFTVRKLLELSGESIRRVKEAITINFAKHKE